MTFRRVCSLLVFMMAVGAATPAVAQWSSMFPAEEETPEPPQDLPPLPRAAIESGQESDGYQPPLPPNASDYYQQQQRRFPPLPPSRTCSVQDLEGIWRLVVIYEDPPGPETTGFGVNRFQYLMFDKNTVFGKYNSPNTPLPADMVRSEIEKIQQQQGLQQYLLNESAIIYFYSQGIAVDAMACFIVVNERGNFKAGQLILMPPKGQTKTRLAKVYERYNIKSGKQPR
jgi:hypothetical protein